MISILFEVRFTHEDEIKEATKVVDRLVRQEAKSGSLFIFGPDKDQIDKHHNRKAFSTSGLVEI